MPLAQAYSGLKSQHPEGAMPEDHDFVLFSVDLDGTIDGAAAYRAPRDSGHRLGKARATQAGSKKCLIYRIEKGDGGSLTFHRVVK